MRLLECKTERLLTTKQLLPQKGKPIEPLMEGYIISLHKEDHSVGNLKAQAASVNGCKLTFFLTIAQ